MIAVRLVRPSGLRLALALAVALTMWMIAHLSFVVFITLPMSAEGKPELWSLIGTTACVMAAMFFLGSGPVAYVIGRRAWLIALPVFLAAFLGIVALVAYFT